MDIKAKIEEIITKLKNDKDLTAKFTSDPVGTVESLIGVSLPKDQIDSLVNGVKAKLNVDKAGDILGSIKKMF